MTTLRLDPYQETRRANGEIIKRGARGRQRKSGGPIWYQDERKQNEDIDIERMVLDVVNETKKIRDMNITDVIVDGEIERTMDGASVFRLTVHDPERELLKTGALERAIDVNLDGLWFRLVRVDKQGSLVTLEFEDRFVAYLRNKDRVRRANRKKMTRLEFCLLLVRSVKAEKIPVVCPELHLKQPIEKLTREDRRAVARSVTAPGLNADDDLTVKGVKATAKQIRILEDMMDQAEKMQAHEKVILAMIMAVIQESVVGKALRSTTGYHLGVLHQDARPGSSWNQLGGGGSTTSTKHVKGQAKAFITVASDILDENRRISPAELALQTQRPGGGPGQFGQWLNEAKKFLESWGGSSKGDKNQVTRHYKKRYMFTTEEGNKAGGKPMDYWDALGALMEEVNFRRFSSNGFLYLISEDQLFRGKVRMVLSPDTPGVTDIDFTYDTEETETTARVTCRAARWVAPPGSIIRLKGCGPANGKWLVETIRRNIYARDCEITLKKPTEKLPEPAPEVGEGTVDLKEIRKDVNAGGGAQGIVDAAFKIAKAAGGNDVYVGSDFRGLNDIVSSGKPSDHSELGPDGKRNPKYRSARDIGVRDIDLHVGPPSPKLDRGVVQIGKAFGRNYGNGRHRIVDTFEWKGFRIQIIWRTPEYGGHMGHIHIGARWLGTTAEGFRPYRIEGNNPN